MRWTCILLFVVACGDDDVALDAALDALAEDAAPTDGGVDDARIVDASTSDTSSDTSGADASGDAPSVDEDCATDTDEDGNGYGGCADPICWDETRCVDAELADNDVSGWTLCGESVELDEEATTGFCEAGIPFPTEREFNCGRVPTTIRLDVYCEPDEGPGRALRYRVAMDLTSEDEPLGPMSTRHTSFTAELGYFGTLYTASGGGASSSSDTPPTADAWTDRYRASTWVVAESGTQVIVLLGASSQTSTFTALEDGGVSVSRGDLIFFLTAGLDTRL